MNEHKDPPSHMWTQYDVSNDDNIASISREDGTEESFLEIRAWDVDRTIAELPLMSQRSAYLTVFHFAKSVCHSRSREIERSRAL
jgi:hypothetical protein